jgi:hypothetical protein
MQKKNISTNIVGLISINLSEATVLDSTPDAGSSG